MDTKHKRGDVREDGKIFWHYSGKYERWLDPSRFAEYQQMSRDITRRQREKRDPAPSILSAANRLSADALAQTIAGLQRLLVKKLDRISALAKSGDFRQDVPVAPEKG